MDEILIGEKKYISSKQAAKATGYAKDYVGQLCREGRVPARLVGRSWYVLESAIHDHRFGEKVEQEKTALPTEILPSTWESPRYEPATAEGIPAANADRDESIAPKDDEKHLQDSWKAWFERVGDTATSIGGETSTVTPDAIQEKQEKGEQQKEIEVEGEETNVPIHAIYHQPPEELLPRRREIKLSNPSNLEDTREQKGNTGAMKTMQIAGAVLAVLMAVIAVLSTGYFDAYIISNNQVGLFAGVYTYNK